MPRKIQLSIKPKLNSKQRLIAENKYLVRNTALKSSRETVREMFMRIAKFIASAEKKYNVSQKQITKLENDFFEIMAGFQFLSGFTLLDQGREKLMPACYVLPLHDSLKSIYKTLYESVQLHRLGAGIGYDFSEIRPENSLISSTGKEASGPISFMRLFDFSSEIILNRGSIRHAGHMGILRIDHPDIERFINAKNDYSQLTNFNLSVAITDEFMKAYQDNALFQLKHFPNHLPSRQKGGSWRARQAGKSYKKISARNLMRQIAESVHKSGEPGVIFIDEINRKNTIPGLDKITATNLCGEQPLLPYESCNLGSIVLDKFIKSTNSKKLADKIDWKRLEKVTRLGVRFLDNTIDLTYYILPQIKKIVRDGNRKIGLGVMGWADLLVQLNIPYDSNKAVELAGQMMQFIQKISHEESCKLGKMKGSFKNFDKSIYPKLGYKTMRNATTTTIAPTGTTSLFADCNGGIEPYFALVYSRNNMGTLQNKKMIYVNKFLEKSLKDEWLYSKKLINLISKAGSIQNIENIPSKLQKIFNTALELTPESHLNMQAAFQKYTDNSVSKTINVNKTTSAKKIEQIFIDAYKLKLKGITIYRNKSRNKQVLNVKL